MPDLIDYNMPLTTAYLKRMKMGCMNANEQVIAVVLDLSPVWGWGAIGQVPASLWDNP